MIKLFFKVGANPQPIVHTGYNKIEDAKKAFEPVSNPRLNHWIVEIFNGIKKIYAVMPEDTFHILRRNDFTLFNRKWEIARC